MTDLSGSVEQPLAEELVASFHSVVEGVKGDVALFNRSERALEQDPEASKTYSLTLDQVQERIALRETSELYRPDLAALELEQLNAARSALLGESSM